MTPKHAVCKSQAVADIALWVVLIAVLTVMIAVWAAVFADGVYQVTTGRQALLPFDRVIRKRMPATELDCVRQGAGKVLQAFGMALIQTPITVVVLRSAAALTGVIPSGPTAPPPLGVGVFLIAALFGPLLLGFAVGMASYVVTTRINYVATDGRVLPTWRTPSIPKP